MKKTGILFLVMLCSLGLVFASAQKEANEKQIIEISSNVTEEGQIATQQTVFETLVGEYNQTHGTQYELRFVSGQGMDITNTRMSSKDKPDIFTIDSPADVHRYQKDGLLLDLTPYAKQYNWEGTLFDWAYKLSIIDDKVYTLPFGYEGMVVWYNKEIMGKLGLTPESLTNLASFESALKKAQDSGYIPIMLGSQDWPWAQEWYLSILFSYTGRELLKSTIEGKEAQGWNQQAFRTTVELVKSWNDKGYLADGKSFTLTSDDAINAFTSGKALFKVEGTWAPYWIIPLAKEDYEKIGVMLHPAINANEQPHMPLAVGGMWCASASTQHADISGYILSNMMRDEFQGKFLESGLDIAPKVIDEAQFANLSPIVQEMWKMVNTALDNGSFGYTTWAFFPPETRLYAYEGIVDVYGEKITIDAYLAELQRLNTKELKEGFVPVIPSAK
nr:ABC transporter substrate-binding protein [uncultured Sphaerochaeta sp.]